MLEFHNISKIYPDGTAALQDINLVIQPQELISIIGKSGTGKTTLVKLINAEEKPTFGQVIVGGWDITHIRAWEIPYLRRQIGIVYQDFRLLPQKTVFENVAFALEVCGISLKEMRTMVPQALAIVGLEGLLDRYPRQLSGGEQQRVAIARALVLCPKILIADEPTGNLDSIHTQEIANLLLKINALGTTILLVTHNTSVVNFLKRRVITMRDGQIVDDKKVGKYEV